MEEEYNLETMQVNLNIKYLNNLINGCSKSNINCENIKKKLNKLYNEIHENQNYSITEQKIKIVNDITEKGITEKGITEKGITETETIEYLYLKIWSKLTQIHKVIKIKEFVNNLDISNQTEKENLKDKLIDQIKKKKGKNKINYDETKGKILSISNLSFENNKYILN
jgi:hypothetical protein